MNDFDRTLDAIARCVYCEKKVTLAELASHTCPKMPPRLAAARLRKEAIDIGGNAKVEK